MPTTLPNIKLASTEWHDLNTMSGISVGVPMDIQNIGYQEIQISVSETAPDKNSPNVAYRILERGDSYVSQSGDPTVWAYVQSADAYVNVAKVVDAAATQRTAFGELSVESMSPISQVTAQYGLTPNVVKVESNGGTVTTEQSNFVVQSGTDPVALADVTALRLVKYRAGLGLRCRITAVFETGGFPNSQQGVGLFTSEDGFLFGYIGSTFGIVRLYGGNDETQRLTLTAPAAGAEIATVTINGIGYPVNLTAGTAAHNAYEIATQLTGVVPDYFITSNQNTVTAQSNLPGPQGAFAFSSATAVGTWAQLAVGVQPNVDFVARENWNQDTAPWLDTTKGNVYQIAFEYLGYGGIDFFIEEPNSGGFVLVHRIKYANNNVIPSASNPIFRMGWVVRNLGNTQNVVLKGASAAAFVDGKIFRSGPLFSLSAEALAVDQTRRTVLILRVRRNFNSKINRIELFPIQISVSSQTTKAAFFELLLNPTFGADVVFDYVDEAKSVVEYSTDHVTVSGGVSVGSTTASQGDSQSIQFNNRDDLKTIFNPGDVIAVVARVNATPASDMQASITWQEDL